MRTQGRWQLALAIILAAVSPTAFSINLQPPCPNTSACPNYVVRDLTSYPPANSVALADTQEYEFDILSSSNQQVGVTLDYILQTFTFDIPHSVPPFDNIQAFAEIDLSDNGGLLFKQAINAFNDGQQSVKSTVVGTVASPAAVPLTLQTNTVYSIFLVASGGVDASLEPRERSVSYAQSAVSFDPTQCPGCSLIVSPGVPNSIDGQGLPPNLPIPAAGWLLLSGLGVIGSLGRKARH